ncbi:polyprenyl synthetase family protein [Crossiella sp. CA-258035]|uniref:polyprenyl synthetase family protein n=1 Tax=Crossiella sp. CA-258035 TaxID=2981138 RepID=UPI0024BC4F00|nr:polyprenyl synthetase family protein [Crossiella sp. CA-258035]WHT16263.1 polyprenyl synthetase family protein [Crossiella sp. CA-258035]
MSVVTDTPLVFRGLLAEELADFFARAPHRELVPELADELSALILSGGKRLRPAFAWCGWLAAGGPATGPAARATLRALVALELLQGCALVHDDVMDRSATRRGRPSAHEAFARRHERGAWAGQARRYGESSAILVGDLALAWADDALVTAGLPSAALGRAWEPWRAMRTEMIAGQHLELLGGARRAESTAEAVRVAELKTAAYTVERPLQLGAAIADGAPELVAALRAYGRDVGVAFQLRDDLLGVFGDCARTGKPAEDDLREGRRTVLMTTALELARANGNRVAERILRACLDGGATDLERVRTLLIDLGAVAAVEQRIDQLTDRGLRALDRLPLAPEPREQLRLLASRATRRGR